jgi:hypothetical protein
VNKPQSSNREPPRVARGTLVGRRSLGLAVGVGVVVLGWFATPVIAALLGVWTGRRLHRMALGGYLAATGAVWTLLYVPAVLSGCGGGPGGVSGIGDPPVVATVCSVSGIWLGWAILGVALLLIGIVLTAVGLRERSRALPLG